MAFKMKGFEPHNMYKTKKANTHKDHLALEKKGYDHNPYKKVSSFTKKEKPPVNETPEEAIKRLKKDKRHFQKLKAKSWLTGDKEGKEAMQEDIDHTKRLIEQQEIARDQDPGTGENNQEQLLSSIKSGEKDLKRITKKGGNTTELQKSNRENKKIYEELYGKLPPLTELFE